MLHSESSSAQSSVNTTTILSNTSNSSPCADSTSSLPATNHAAEDMTQQHQSRLTQTETMTNNNNSNGQQHPTATIHTHDINVLEDKKKESKQETSSSTTTSSELGTSLSQDMMSSRVETNHEESTLLPSSSESTTPRESIIQMSSEESQQQQQQKEGSSSSSQSDIDDDDEDVMEPNNGNDDEDAEEDMSNNASHKYFNIRLPHKNDIHLLSTLRSKVSCSPIYLTQYTALESSAMMMKRRHQRSVSTMRGAVGSHNHPTSNGGGIQLSQSVSLDSLASSQTSSIASSSLGVSSSIPSSSSTHLLNSTTKTTTPNSGIFLNDMNGTLFQEESALKLFLSNAYNKKHSSSAAISASALFTSSTTEEDTVNILLQAPQPSPSTTTTTAAATTRMTANDATGGSTTHPSKHIGSDSMNGGVSLFTTNTTTGNMNQSGANSPSSVSVENLNNCKIYYFYTPYEKAFMTSTVPPSSSANANIKNNNEPKMAQPSVGSSSSTSAPITTIEKTTTLVEQQQEHKELSSGHHHHTIAASISETPHSESGSSGATQALIEIGDQIQQQAHHHLNIKEPTAMLSSNLSESTNHTTSMVNPVIINNNGNINPVNTVPASSSCDKASTTHSEQVNHPPHLINVEPPPPPSSSQNTNDSTLSQSRLLLENHTQLSLNLKPSSSATQNQATNPSAQYSTTNPHRRVQSDTAAFQCMQLGSTTTTTTTTGSNGSNDSQDNMSMKTPPSRGKQTIHDLSEQNSFAFSGANNGNILDQSEGDIRFMLGNEDMTPGGSSAVTSPSSTDSQLGMSLPVNGSNFDMSRAHMKRSGSVRGLNKTVFSPLDKKKSHRRVQSFNVAPITPSLGFSSETEIRAVTIELVLLDIDACFTKFEPLKIISDLWTKDLDYFKFGVKIFNRMYVWLEDSLVHQFTVEKSDLVDCPTIEFVLPEQPVAKIIDATCAIINEFNTKYTYSYYNCHSFSFARKVTEKLSGKKIKSKNVLPKTLVHHFREWREAEKKRKEKEEKEAKEEKEHAKSSSDKSPVTNAASTTAESSDATPLKKIK
ncbi:hypothetical protein C9374_012159 [Naegleria lovaniensis]|uniref:Uncharacterized protein n=1 Tax=Naegleria lovaniensis TaxID=51637 RepID=A0AA88GDH0_NAELO|nr:uncharacterized protein C9374_012159 [Naegleria lovaniensis]KAG2373420.1 hypothetical protein C9374_012159 [Naegleria lovaniensis]